MLLSLVSARAEASFKTCALQIARSAFFASKWIEDIELSRDTPSHWVTDPRELSTITDTMVDSFATDPLLNWMSADRATREKIASSEVINAFLSGGVLSADPVGTGAALWRRERKESRIASWFRVRLSGENALGKLFGARDEELGNFFTALEEARSPIIESNEAQGTLYLIMVGVRPEARGRKLASKVLVQPVLNYVPTPPGSPFSWKPDEPQNIPLYTRMGFTVSHQASLGW